MRVEAAIPWTKSYAKLAPRAFASGQEAIAISTRSRVEKSPHWWTSYAHSTRLILTTRFSDLYWNTTESHE